ncbi:DHA2 family efflux MFS transporter permease subunit [Spirillospora sp. NPDC029432]|uniref:DHA2 family efflux MFS transporter permease subunit n=1 Tax=Spirillospora sp. NPDC029432 TaxID=3154599 RepID=UPI0034521271
MTASSPQPPDQGLDRALIAMALVVSLGAVMPVLDATVVNVALTRLGRDLDASLAAVQWVATGYTLALATVIPVTGWASARFGARRLYLVSIGLFAAGSALAGTAWNAESLIAFRVVQGLGGGMIMPAGMTILARAAGPPRVGRVMSVVGIPMMLGPIAGPLLGGWLLDHASWRWIFFVNVPVGALAWALSWRTLPRDEPCPAERLDFLGLLLLSPGLAALIYGLATGAERSDFARADVLAATATGTLLVMGFVVRSLRRGGPGSVIDLRLFRRRSVATAAAALAPFACAIFGSMLLLPLYYQTVRGETALMAGLLLVPQALGMAATMRLGGRLTDRAGPGRVVPVGLVVVAAGMAGFASRITVDASYWVLSGAQFVLGLGLGLTMMPVMSAAMRAVRHDEVPRATTAMNIVQQLAASVGTAFITVLLATRLAAGGAPAAGQDARTADAFQATYWWALAVLALAFVPALLFPRDGGTSGGSAPGRPAALTGRRSG